MKNVPTYIHNFVIYLIDVGFPTTPSWHELHILNMRLDICEWFKLTSGLHPTIWYIL